MRSALLLLLLVMCLPVAAAAQPFQSTWFGYADAAFLMPSSPGLFIDRWKKGWGGGAGVGLRVNPWIVVYTHFEGASFLLDDSRWVDELDLDSVEGGDIAIWRGSVGGRANVSYPDPNARFVMYLLGSGGVIRRSKGAITGTVGGVETLIEDKESEYAFAASAGFGVDWLASERVRFYADAQAVLGLTEEDTVYFPLRIGVTVKLANGPYL
jgi:hypothetical protein